MKKIIALFAIMLACGFSANAQQKQTSPATEAARQKGMEIKAAAEKAAIKDVTMMSEFIKLTDAQKNNFKGLFSFKHEQLLGQPLSNDRKTVLAEQIEMKIKASLTPDQVTQLNNNPDLLKKLKN